MNRGARLVLAVGASLAAAVGGACSDDGRDAAPRPVERPVTEVVDHSGIALRSVPGQTTTTLPPERGTAVLHGSVAGPGGLLAGATVRIERIVPGGEVRTDVLTGPDGRFEVRDLPGGRYRVRAFLAPAYALTSPEVRFLEDRKEHAFDLVVEEQRRIVARASVAPDPPVIGEAVNLAAVVASRAVDPDGVIRSTPVTGVRVQLSGLGRWMVRDVPGANRPILGTTSTTVFRPRGDADLTDAAGQVRFELRCQTAGAPGLSLLIPVTVQPEGLPDEPPPPPTTRMESVDLDLPDCIDPTAVPATTPDDVAEDQRPDDGR